uniref:Uncharacterized protein n=1 Tax=Trichuris muris TaxID=70415 RepID=A0A5S6Q042_TRIMR
MSTFLNLKKLDSLKNLDNLENVDNLKKSGQFLQKVDNLKNLDNFKKVDMKKLDNLEKVDNLKKVDNLEKTGQFENGGQFKKPGVSVRWHTVVWDFRLGEVNDFGLHTGEPSVMPGKDTSTLTPTTVSVPAFKPEDSEFGSERLDVFFNNASRTSPLNIS